MKNILKYKWFFVCGIITALMLYSDNLNLNNDRIEIDDNKIEISCGGTKKIFLIKSQRNSDLNFFKKRIINYINCDNYLNFLENKNYINVSRISKVELKEQ